MKNLCLGGFALLMLAFASCENHNENVGNTKGVLYDTAISSKPTDTISTSTESYTNGPDNAPPTGPNDTAAKKSY